MQFINLFKQVKFSEIMEKGDNSLEKTTDDGEGVGDNKGVCIGGNCE